MGKAAMTQRVQVVYPKSERQHICVRDHRTKHAQEDNFQQRLALPDFYKRKTRQGMTEE